VNRIGAGRLQHMSHILQVQVPYSLRKRAATPRPVQRNWKVALVRLLSDFLASVDGLALTKAFMQIKEPRLRRRIVNLVDQIAGTT
jgi:hypothetical protein